MNRPSKLHLYVALVTCAAAASAVFAWQSREAFPGLSVLGSFLFFALLLEQTNSELSVSAKGSTSFVLHLASGLLFGGFWGAVVAAVSTGVNQAVARAQPIKLIFNVAQRTLSVAVAFAVYRALGGGMPPAYLRSIGIVQSDAVQLDLGLFVLLSVVYFGINSISVNAAISLSTGRPFREVWSLNARGVVGYDLGASCLAILLAWLYGKSAEAVHFGPLGLIVVMMPILVIRHIYGLYRKLQNTGRELLDLMVKAIEARDPYTSGHSVRVATLAKAIAQEAGMSTADIERIYTAALLHDVGKIHEEFAPLLRKDSKLTAEETALLQTHAVKSSDLVGIISSFRGPVQEAVRSHHERWDGTGYPDGLAAEAIPLGARIIMISDTTDAMTTDRPYRKKLSLETVIGELQKYKGTQFDPSLVDLTINSVGVRRVIAGLQAVTSTENAVVSTPLQGGSARVRWRDSGIWKAKRVF
jgi:putative nucleotidyltransferase with HDIG domain